MLRKVFAALVLAAAVAFLSGAALARAGHDHGVKAKKVKKSKPKKGGIEFIVPQGVGVTGRVEEGGM